MRVARLEGDPAQSGKESRRDSSRGPSRRKWAANARSRSAQLRGGSAETATGVTHPPGISTLAHGVIEGLERPEPVPANLESLPSVAWPRLSQRRSSPTPTINVGSAARGLTGNERLSFCALGECLGAHHYEQPVGRRQRPTGIEASASSQQPFAVQELCSGGRGTPEKWDSGARVSPETSRGPVCKKLRLLPARMPISMQWLKMPRISPLGECVVKATPHGS